MKLVQRYKIGARLLISGFVFNFFETWYFGWNLRPQSVSEMICDYIGGFLMILGFLAIAWCQIEKRQKYYGND